MFLALAFGGFTLYKWYFFDQVNNAIINVLCYLIGLVAGVNVDEVKDALEEIVPAKEVSDPESDPNAYKLPRTTQN